MQKTVPPCFCHLCHCRVPHRGGNCSYITGHGSRWCWCVRMTKSTIKLKTSFSFNIYLNILFICGPICLTNTLPRPCRYHRNRSPFYRSHCRRPNNTKSQHTSIEEWYHTHVYAGSGPKSTHARTNYTCLIHELLQPDLKLWRGENDSGCKRSWCQWIHYCRLTPRRGHQI